MKDSKILDKEIAEIIEQLSRKQKEIVLSVVKAFAREEPWWNDESYRLEMDKRFRDLENGDVQALNLEELELGARENYVASVHHFKKHPGTKYRLQ